MKPDLQRWVYTRLTAALLAVATALLRSRHPGWARAMRAEVLAIDEAQEALRYAWGCFTTAAQLAAAAQPARLRAPDHLGLVCASLVVGLGVAFMASQEAPSRYPWVNGLSLALAGATFWLLPRARLQQDARWRAAATFALGALLLWAAAPRPDTGVATGWLRFGPLPVQPTWLLCPAWWAVSAPIGRTAPRPWALRALHLAGLLMGLAALAVHAQAALLAVTAVLFAARAVQTTSVAPAALAVLALALAQAALARWTAPPPSPFVDEVLQRAFTQGLGLGALLTAAWLSLLLPGLLHRRAREHGLAWAALLLLALPGWLPAPVLGFGGSFIVGYVLSLAVLPGDPAHPADRASALHGPPAPADRPHAHHRPPRPRTGLA